MIVESSSSYSSSSSNLRGRRLIEDDYDEDEEDFEELEYELNEQIQNVLILLAINYYFDPKDLSKKEFQAFKSESFKKQLETYEDRYHHLRLVLLNDMDSSLSKVKSLWLSKYLKLSALNIHVDTFLARSYDVEGDDLEAVQLFKLAESCREKFQTYMRIYDDKQIKCPANTAVEEIVDLVKDDLYQKYLETHDDQDESADDDEEEEASSSSSQEVSEDNESNEIYRRKRVKTSSSSTSSAPPLWCK